MTASAPTEEANAANMERARVTPATPLTGTAGRLLNDN